MNTPQIQLVVRILLTMLQRISKKTRTPADDLMTSILQTNESRLTQAAEKVLALPNQPPTEEQIVAILKEVGMQV